LTVDVATLLKLFSMPENLNMTDGIDLDLLELELQTHTVEIIINQANPIKHQCRTHPPIGDDLALEL
jgi:hypothetical protein